MADRIQSVFLLSVDDKCPSGFEDDVTYVLINWFQVEELTKKEPSLSKGRFV